MNDKKHIHLIGICGTAMASLAGMLKQRGFRVTGSDAAAYPPMSEFLAQLGIPVLQPFGEETQPRADIQHRLAGQRFRQEFINQNLNTAARVVHG